MRYLPEARADLIETAAYYESCEPGLGDRFLARVDEAVSFVDAHPEGSALVLLPDLGRPVQQRVLRKFPYVVFYMLDPDPVMVALSHARQRPGHWVDRLG